MNKITALSVTAVFTGWVYAGNIYLVDTHRSPYAQMWPVEFDSVKWTEGFWAERARQAQTVSLRKLWELAADPDAGHVLDNFRAAATGQGEHAGTNWQDAWLYKWIEAAACAWRETRDPWIADRMDEAIELIEAAQQPDGYISTQITVKKKPRFQEPREHEVYCMGHLLTAGCIHRRMTGKDSLFNVAVKCADFLCDTLGKSVSPSFAHNPSAIMGLVEMYRETGKKKYLDCAELIVVSRGKNPKKGGIFNREPGIMGTDQMQDRIPLRWAKEVVGHNVFFTYLYAGAADVYLESGTPWMRKSLERLWEDLTQRKMSINGGVSPMGKGISVNGDPVGEAVGPAYFLPNANAYNETCGQIGNFMWNARMLMFSGDARYADVMERELYNGFLGCVGLDGESWFYRNPLSLRPDPTYLETGHNFMSERGLPGRKRICCPTNLLRTLTELHAYFYSVDEQGLYVHHYGGSTFNGKLPDGSALKLTQETDYPWSGKIVLRIDAVKSAGPFAIRFRIPGWAETAIVKVNGKPTANVPESGRYFFMKRRWKPGDRIELNLPMVPRLMTAHPNAEQLRNQVAVMRGPILYCIESADLPEGTQFDNVYLPSDIKLKPVHTRIRSVDIVALEGSARYRREKKWTTELYRPLKPVPQEPLPIRMIPYFAWKNRGPGAMAVWLPVILRD